jgi:hypothetical protein
LLEASYEKTTPDTYHLGGDIEVSSDVSARYADIAAHYDIGIKVGRFQGAPHRKLYVPLAQCREKFLVDRQYTKGSDFLLRGQSAVTYYQGCFFPYYALSGHNTSYFPMYGGRTLHL